MAVVFSRMAGTVDLSTFDPHVLAVLIAASASLYVLYRRLLPVTIPGTIPYNKSATLSPLGDLPEVHRTFNGRSSAGGPGPGRGSASLGAFLAGQVAKHKSPICQVFVEFPLSTRAAVVLADPVEAQALLLRRGREFDRSHVVSDRLEGLARDHHIRMKTTECCPVNLS